MSRSCTSTWARSPRPSTRTRRRTRPRSPSSTPSTAVCVYFDKDLKVVPALATALPDVSADAKTLTFTLKDGLKYSNGDPIVAGDFVYGIKRTLDPRTAAPYAYVLCEIEGADALLGAANGCGDKEAPTADADIDAALDKRRRHGPRRQDRRRPAGEAGHLLHRRHGPLDRGPGPGEVDHQPERDRGRRTTSAPARSSSTTWDHNSQIVLKPNPNWSGDVKPTLTEIDMSMTTEPAQGQAAFEAGELDMVLTPSEDIQRVKADPTLGPHGRRHPASSRSPTTPTTTRPARRPTRTSASR